MICEIGSEQKQCDFIQNYTDDIYLNAGKSLDNTYAERASFVKRFVRKYRGYTIADVACFANMVIEGDFEIRFLCPTELFNAWNKYLQKRGEAQEYNFRAKEGKKVERGEYVSPEEIEQGLKRIKAAVADSTKWWDEWLETHRAEYERLGKGDVNTSYEEFRQMKLAQLREEGLAV